MKKFGKTKCPYCGRKVGLTGAWILKTQGEYRCPECGGICNIVMSGGVYLLAAVAILLSVICFMIHIFLIVTFSWISLILVGTPFVLFFLLSPLFVRLKKPPVRRRPPSEQNRRRSQTSPEQRKTPQPGSNDLDQTMKIDPVESNEER